MLGTEIPAAPADALTTGMPRRTALRLIGGAGLSALVGCGEKGTGPSTTSADATPDTPVATQPDTSTAPTDALDTASTTVAPETNIRPDLHAGLTESSDPDLKLMGENEKRFGRGFDQAMRFTGMPDDRDDAETRATEFAGVLMEHERQGIGPYVIFEPGGIDLKEGIEKNTFVAYFQTLKDQGVTDASIGTWVLFPEPNIPIWGVDDDLGNTDPGLFKDNFVAVGTALKEVFPGAKVSLILDSATYASHDLTWQSGTYDVAPLLDYVSALPKDLVDEVGLQGFHYGTGNTDPAVYLQGEVARRLAEATGAEVISFNTGTFSEMYADGGNQATATLERRAAILDAVLAQAQIAQEFGRHVRIDLFAPDKPTEADWSYTGDPDVAMMSGWMRQVEEAGIILTYFDTLHP